jgi:transcription elongation factor GreA
MNQTPMTAAGAASLEEELKRLRGVERPRIIAAISEARELGDLKENAEYHAAREEQGFVEGRIKEIEAKLSHAQNIDVTRMPPGDKVIFGATVEILDLDTDAEII